MMRRSATVILPLLLCGLIALPAQASTAQLQSDVNALQAVGSVGVLSGVTDNGVVSKNRAGVAVRGTNTPVPLDAHFRIGSVTKPFVATVVLQLVSEGKLSLDDTVAHWLPNVIVGNGNDGTKITVRQLLNHTSGLFNYTDDGIIAQTLTSAPAYNAWRAHHYTPQDLITFAISHHPNFAPGTQFSYSNTDYVVVGQIIQKVTGNPWYTEVKNRIITPLGLTGTSYPGDTLTLPVPSTNGYDIYTSDPAHRTYTDTTLDNMTWADAAGSLISTVDDENKFMTSLMLGQLLSPAMLAVMKTGSVPNPTVGLGIGKITATCGRVSWGHDGEVIGYNGLALASDDGKTAASLILTTTSYNEAQIGNDQTNGEVKWFNDAMCP